MYETTCCTSSSQIPQTQSLVPRSGKGVGAVRRENDVADEMGVPLQTFLSDTVVEWVTGKIPHDQRLVCDKDKKMNK